MKKKIIGRTVTWKPMRAVLTTGLLGFARVDHAHDVEGESADPEDFAIIISTVYACMHAYIVGV